MRFNLIKATSFLKESFVAYAMVNNLPYEDLKRLFVDEGSVQRLGKTTSVLIYNLIGIYIRLTGRIDLPGSPGINRNCKLCTSISIYLSRLYLQSIYRLYLDEIPTLSYIFSLCSGSQPIKEVEEKKIKKIIGSPSALLGYPWAAVFHIRGDWQLIGYVHGGGYGEFDSNTVEKFEYLASDQYICWGIGAYKKEICSRFRFVPDRKELFIKRYIIPEFNNDRMVGLDFQSHSAFLMVCDFYNKWIFDIDKHLDLPVLVKTHPRSNAPLNADSRYLKSVKSLRSTDLVIIGHPFSTFFYKCLNELQPFIIIYQRDWIDNLSKSYQGVLKSARSLGLLFFYDELEELNRYSNSDYPYNFEKLKVLRDKLNEQ